VEQAPQLVKSLYYTGAVAYPDEDTPLLLLLVLATRHLTEVLQQHLVAAGFHDHRVVHHNVMAHMTHDGVRITELADLAGITKQGMSQLVDDLERLGYLQRIPDPHDGRAKLVQFAPRGRAAVEAANRAFGDIEASLATRIDPEGIRRLRRTLLLLISSLRPDTRPASTASSRQRRRSPDDEGSPLSGRGATSAE
jgi:DNA-binding MarR family transcriptional regulator